jgi:hypothetical protein
VTIGCLASLGLSGAARAECSHFVIPPATEAAPSAREVIVGTVIENVGGQLYDFRLRVDHVLRGPARVGDVRRFEFLFPGWPLADYGGTMAPPCEAIPGSKGNVMALSLDALAPDGKTRYNGASWILGSPHFSDDAPRTTLAEMLRLTGMPATDTVPSTSSAHPGNASAALALVAGLLALIAYLVLGVRRVRP